METREDKMEALESGIGRGREREGGDEVCEKVQEMKDGRVPGRNQLVGQKW
jgi:hypothetical protein